MNEIPLHWINDDSESLDVKIDSTLNQLRERKAKLLEILRLKREIDALARAAIPDLALAKIMEAVSKEFRVGFAELASKTREHQVALPRQVAFYIARSHTALSLNVIGRAFGRDHGTVIHGCKTVQNMIDTDKNFAARTEKVLGRLKLAKSCPAA